MEVLLTTYDSALFNKIGFYVGQAIIAIQDKQPELLLEKYRNVSWNSRYQSSLTAKLTEILRQSDDWDTLIKNLQGFLKVLLISESFNSPILIKLIKSKHLPGKKVKDIFVNYPTKFAVHQMSEQSELYVTLFEINQVQQVDTSNDDVQQTNVASLSRINSKTDLEQALKNIIKKLTT